MSTTAEKPAEHWDVVVVGSGFGGSVAALRLSEKGYKVLVVESGRRFTDEELPKTSWRLPKFLWAPAWACSASSASPCSTTSWCCPAPAWAAARWCTATPSTNPSTTSTPTRSGATSPSGVTSWPRTTSRPSACSAWSRTRWRPPPTGSCSRSPRDMGVADTFHRTHVGVLFGERPGEDVEDPFFGGAGPARTTCDSCGSCMTGCRVGAKNTLPKNYLHLAEGLGAQHPATDDGHRDRPRRPEGGYRVVHARGRPRRRPACALAGHRRPRGPGRRDPRHPEAPAHDEGLRRSCPAISDRLGQLTRTNSESILTVEARDLEVDYSDGPGDHVVDPPEPADPRGAGPVRPGQQLHGDAQHPAHRGRPSRRAVGAAAASASLAALRSDPRSFLRSLSVRRWSQRTTVMLVMQSLDNSLNVSLKREQVRQAHPGLDRRAPANRTPRGSPRRTRWPRGSPRRPAARPAGPGPRRFNIPMTAHILGGAPIGDSPQTGVIDPWQRVYGHDGIHVVDGAAVSANLGVNPSLTITAQAERAMSFWPNKGEADPRPELGQPPTGPSRPCAR